MGIHGFWRSYRNIDRLITDELELDARRVFTRYERSALHTKVRHALRRAFCQSQKSLDWVWAFSACRVYQYF